jgi:hypothetical protein
MFDNNKNIDGDAWWPIMYRDEHDYYRSCDACQRIKELATQSLAKLVTSLLEKPFMKWGLDFVETNKKIYKKQIYSYCHKLCY